MSPSAPSLFTSLPFIALFVSRFLSLHADLLCLSLFFPLSLQFSSCSIFFYILIFVFFF